MKGPGLMTGLVWMTSWRSVWGTLIHHGLGPDLAALKVNIPALHPIHATTHAHKGKDGLRSFWLLIPTITWNFF